MKLIRLVVAISLLAGCSTTNNAMDVENNAMDVDYSYRCNAENVYNDYYQKQLYCLEKYDVVSCNHYTDLVTSEINSCNNYNELIDNWKRIISTRHEAEKQKIISEEQAKIKEYAYFNEFKDKCYRIISMPIEPKVINMSGFDVDYNNIFRIDISKSGYDCSSNSTLDKAPVIEISHTSKNFILSALSAGNKINIIRSLKLVVGKDIDVTDKIAPTIYIEAINATKFPNYVNEDENIKIIVNNRNISLINKSRKYLQINSIALYLGDDISNFKLSQQEDIIELPPSSKKNDVYVGPFIKNKINEFRPFNNITYDTAKKTNIDIGFAIKYKIVDISKEYTLYKVNKYNALELISVE